jgi:endonuclease/exonuclease/phosphatase family metal-dependent hydrolase
MWAAPGFRDQKFAEGAAAVPGLMSANEFIIVARDLNDGRGQPALRRIQGYDDIWPDLVQTGDARFFGKTDLGTRWTYDYLGTRNQIDHILISPSIEAVTAPNRGVRPRVPEQTNPVASDHRPFVLTLDLL